MKKFMVVALLGALDAMAGTPASGNGAPISLIDLSTIPIQSPLNNQRANSNSMPRVYAGSNSASNFDLKFPPDGKCEAENEAVTAQKSKNLDVHIRPDANLTVMFHGNRYVVAEEIVRAYEKLNSGTRISWTTLPPRYSFEAVPEIVKLPPGAQADTKFKEQLGADINPDVVMLPSNLASVITDAVSYIGTYSKVHGVIMLSRKNDNIDNLMDIVTQSNLRVVFPPVSSAGASLPAINAVDAALGNNAYRKLLLRNNTGYSNPKHHRFVPLRIAAKCEDVGFQYLQSKRTLETQYPGLFTFTPIPASREILEREDSAVFVVNKSANREEAMKFAKFMMSDKAQVILKKYDLAAVE